MVHDMGVPGYASPNDYNYIAYAFWLTTGPADIALLWSNPVQYMGTAFGQTNEEIQLFLKSKFIEANIKLLVSAFGSTDHPTSKDPIVVAQDLANFVLSNHFDGVDIDYEENAAMEAGTGVPWLISFTTKLRELLPGKIITHAPQGPYFKSEVYPQEGYVGVHNAVGNMIDFYNVQFYNQGNTQYNSYTELFTQASGYFSGTSVKEIIDRGIPSEKIVVGKPASQADVMNTGYVNLADVGSWGAQAYH